MKRARTLALTLLAVLLASSLTAAPTQADTTGKFSTLTFTTRLASTGTTLTTQPGGRTFGWNNLTGTTTWGDMDATVVFLGDVNYIRGSGPFNGYVTITREDGVSLSLRTEGDALAVPESSGATITFFSGAVQVIQGTGPFRGATGIGTTRGVRRSSLGSPVQLTFRISVLRR